LEDRAQTLAFVIPVFNEMPALPSVIEAWRGVSLPGAQPRWWIVDDGSTDGSSDYLDEVSRRDARVTVVHQSNGGHGAAILAGYRRAVDAGVDWILQVDGDGQFDPVDAPRLWDARTGADMVIAQRPPSGPRLSSDANRWVAATLFGFRGPDLNAGFRLLSGPVLGELLPLLPGAPAAPNTGLVLIAHHRKKNLRWVPTALRPPPHPPHAPLTRQISVLVRALVDHLRLWRRLRPDQ
jgi:glycosyltransferase involved in cell wall biosynthesis